MSTTHASRPVVRLKPKADRRIRHGHPWAYSNEIEMDAAAKALEPGEAVRLETAGGEPLGCYIFNRHPLIAARLLTRDADAELGPDFFRDRLAHALALRERLVGVPYYRLAHAEADGLPGTVIDRYGDAVVLQINTAGMERYLDDLLAALDAVIAPKTVVLRNDSPVRELEGLDSYVKVLRGDVSQPVEILEHGARFLADLGGGGQKTGWFYDQRDNRRFAGRLIAGVEPPARVLDAYSFCGGFAIQAALAGAGEVVAIDRSRSALDLAAAAAELNGVAERCTFRRADVFAALEHLARKGERFDLVIADPPAFVKGRKDLPQGLKGYRKLARLAGSLVAERGMLVMCSCSHHVEPAVFAEQVRRGLYDAGREARVLQRAGAAPDHPLHPALPETAYLKAEFLALD